MAIRFECEQCGSVLKIKEELAGKPGKCPKCKTPFTVPTLDEESDLDEEQSLAGDDSESEDSAPAQPPPPKTSGDDFDVDAFLMDDSAPPPKSKPRAAAAKRPSPDDDDDSLSDDEEESPPPKKAKPSKAADLDDDDDQDTPSAPTRRPPGTNASGTAANFASDLLTKSGKKGKKTNWSEAEAQAQARNQEPGYDWSGLSKYLGTRILPAAAGVMLAVYLLYSLVSSSMSGSTFKPTLGRVTGNVKLDGKPVAGAEVWFHPIVDDKTPVEGKKQYTGSSSMGMTDPQGNYEQSYSADLKGAIVGPCRIEIMAIGRSDIPKKYVGKNATEQREVKPGRQVIDFDLSK